MKEYAEFIRRKSQCDGKHGFDPLSMPSFLFDFQSALVEWAIRIGRGALFADCGLGKTPMQLVWADNVVRKTNKPVLVLTPLAVAVQTVSEAHKFGMEAVRSSGGPIGSSGIVVANYEKLHLFDAEDFAGVVCDESSILKSFNGKRRREITRFMAKMPYRLLCTATAAPNDYIELGTSSEAIGQLGQMDMLSTFFRSTDDMAHVFFKNGDFWNTHKWMFKAHAEDSFWKWVCSWARAVRKPSDLGFDDGQFELPPLSVNQHVVEVSRPFDGELFPRVAVTMNEQREERRLTMKERVAKVGELVDHGRPAVVWCHLNEEGDMLAESIPGARQICGATPDDEKEELFTAFSSGELRVLVTKPKIGALGLNWQHCDHMTFFPSHSFEQYYQGVRRCWRFGQKRPVTVDIVTTPGEAGVTANLNAKADAAAAMFDRLVAHMNESIRLDRSGAKHDVEMEMPSWL